MRPSSSAHLRAMPRPAIGGKGWPHSPSDADADRLYAAQLETSRGGMAFLKYMRHGNERRDDVLATRQAGRSLSSGAVVHPWAAAQ